MKRNKSFQENNIDHLYSILYDIYRTEWEDNLPESLQSKFLDCYDKPRVLLKNKLWNRFLRSKNFGIYFNFNLIKPRVYCSKKFLLTYLQYCGQ